MAAQSRSRRRGCQLGTDPVAPNDGEQSPSERSHSWLTPFAYPVPYLGTEKTLTFETGKLAPQSQGAVVAMIGGTRVLTTANAAKDVRPGMDFFPLTVDVEERVVRGRQDPRLVLPS